MVYEGGVANVTASSNSLGAGISRNGIGLGAGNTKTQGVSIFAAEPEPHRLHLELYLRGNYF